MKKAWVLGLMVLPVVAFAEVPEGDALQTLLNLILNWKASGPVVIGMGLVTFVVQAMKQFVGDFNYKRLLVAVLGAVYATLVSMSQGMGVVEAIVMALFVSGGAVAIYEALKPVLPKNA